MPTSRPSIRHARMNDADQLDDLLSGWNIDSTQLEAGEIELTSQRLIFGDIVVEKSFQNLSKTDRYSIPSDSTLFCFAKPDSQPVSWCGKQINADQLVLNFAEREYDAVLPGGHEHLSILVRNSRLDSWGLLSPLIEVSGNSLAHHLMPLPQGRSNAFRRWLLGILDSEKNLELPNDSPFDGEYFEQELIEGLSQILGPNLSASRARSLATRWPERARLLRRVCAAIQDQLRESISISELASDHGVSPRTLQRAFTQVYGVTPHQYVRRQKLKAVRRELRDSLQHSDTVSRIALSYGFTELGRFSVIYRSFFGESPSVTLGRGKRQI